MKAEINKDGLLIILFESKEEEIALNKWVKENNGQFIVPINRAELAMIKFGSIKTAICSGISWDRWGIAM
jgi:hypothetical protein